MPSFGPLEIVLMLITLVISFIIPILIVLALVNFFMRKNQEKGSAGKSAISYAKERYAKGEITKDDFEEIRRNL